MLIEDKIVAFLTSLWMAVFLMGVCFSGIVLFFVTRGVDYAAVTQLSAFLNDWWRWTGYGATLLILSFCVFKGNDFLNFLKG